MKLLSIREAAKKLGVHPNRLRKWEKVASGLNQKRRGLDRMLKAAEQGEFKGLLIEYPDRLTRFGFDYLERHLKFCGVESARAFRS